MDSFGSDFSAGGSGGKIDTGTIMEQVKVQIAVANAQELLQRMTDKCFKKCIGKPGSSLDNSEQKCIAMCMDRYMDAWNTVSRTYNSRLQRERARMWETFTWPLLYLLIHKWKDAKDHVVARNATLFRVYAPWTLYATDDHFQSLWMYSTRIVWAIFMYWETRLDKQPHILLSFI